MKIRTFLFEEFWDQIPFPQRSFQYCGFEPIVHRRGFISAYLNFNLEEQKLIVARYSKVLGSANYWIACLTEKSWEKDYQKEIVELGKVEARKLFVENCSEVVVEEIFETIDGLSTNEDMISFFYTHEKDVMAACDIWSQRDFPLIYKLPMVACNYYDISLPNLPDRDYARDSANYKGLLSLFVICEWLTFYHSILDWNRRVRKDEHYSYHEVKELSQDQLSLEEPFVRLIS